MTLKCFFVYFWFDYNITAHICIIKETTFKRKITFWDNFQFYFTIKGWRSVDPWFNGGLLWPYQNSRVLMDDFHEKSCSEVWNIQKCFRLIIYHSGVGISTDKGGGIKLQDGIFFTVELKRVRKYNSTNEWVKDIPINFCCDRFKHLLGWKPWLIYSRFSRNP